MLGAGVVLATAILVGAMVLPLLLGEQHAASERPRIQSLVDSVVAAEVEKLKTESAYVPIAFGASNPEIGIPATDRRTIADYAIVARQVSSGAFRVQAWPRPSALASDHAAAVSYFVELSDDGRILTQGWLPDAADEGGK